MIKKGKGTYQHKKDKDHKVFVYDITHCVDDDKTYYSYSDPLDCRYFSSAEDKFLEKFAFMEPRPKRSKYTNMFSEEK